MRHIKITRQVLCLGLLTLIATIPLYPATYTVTNTTDSNAGSLRWAILQNNANPGANTINFNIPTSDSGYDAASGTWTISPLTELDHISNTVTINGYSQPGASVNTLVQGDNAVLKIILNGSDYTVGDPGISGAGLYFVAGSDNSVVRGLVINEWILAGIVVDATDAEIDGISIVGNFIGTNATGTQVSANTTGIGLTSPGDFDPVGTIIGTPALEDRNIIAGSLTNISTNDLELRGGCIYSFFGINTTIQNNYIGTDVTGTQALGNSLAGLYLRYDNGNLIGGPDAGMRNIISGHLAWGMLTVAMSNSTVQGNYIGTDVTGTQAVGNGFAGISASGPIILSGDAGTNFIDNVISGNGRGIRLGDNQSPGCILNTIQNNKIGTDYSGTKAIPNTLGFGIEISDGQNTVNNNLISNNEEGGIHIYSTIGTLTEVYSNLIGTDITGTKPMPNNGPGIQIGSIGNLAGFSTQNTIGA